MLRRLKIFNAIVSLATIGALLPAMAFAQLKTLQSVTTEAPQKQSSVSSVTAAPRESVTTDTMLKTSVAVPTTQLKTTQIISPTTGFVAPVKTSAPVTGVVAPTKEIAPSTAVPQKTVTAVPTASAPARTVSGVPVTAERRYAAAEVVYQARILAALQAAADVSVDGTSKGLPLQLMQLPGAPMLNVWAESGEGIVFQVVGGGTYDVRGVVVGANNETLDEFHESEFAVLLSAYDDPRAVAVIVTYLPEEPAPTFFAGGITLPPPTGATPIAPTTPTVPTKPIAVQPVAPVMPGVPSEVFELTLPLVAIAPSPGEGGIVRKIPSGEAPEEIIPEEEVPPALLAEEEVPEEFALEGEEFAEAPAEEEPSFLENVADFFGFGGEEEVTEEVPEEVTVEGELAFEGEEGGAEEGELALGEAPAEELRYDFTDFGVSSDEFVGEEAVGDLGFGFDFGDLALAPEEEEIISEEEEEAPAEEFAFEGGEGAGFETGELGEEVAVEEPSFFENVADFFGFGGEEEEEAPAEEFALGEVPEGEEAFAEEGAEEEEAPAVEAVLALAFTADSANPIPTEASDRTLTLDVAAEEDLNLFGSIDEATLILERQGTVTSIDGVVGDSQIAFELTDDVLTGLLDGPANASARLTIAAPAGNITFIYYLGSVGAEEAAL